MSERPSSPHRRFFITLEGGDGSGKSTQARALCRLLEDNGFAVCLTREPAGTALGALIKQTFERGTAAGTPALSPQAELLFFAAARADHVRTVVRPALEAGKIVLCDRFTDSTLAYQGYGRGLSLDEIGRWNRVATEGLTPDLTLLFDVPPEAGLARADAHGVEKGDSIGGEPLEFHRRVHEGYLALARQEPSRIVVIDGARPSEEVTALAWQAMQPALGTLRLPSQPQG
ncbi:MAG: dTMP kinase [Chloroflexi bacterium]|nr:MAG: dTMP kinase [Chloroflexota bacterium]